MLFCTYEVVFYYYWCTWLGLPSLYHWMTNHLRCVFFICLTLLPLFQVRTYYLAVDSETEMISWVQCLCHVCGLKQEDNRKFLGTKLTIFLVVIGCWFVWFFGGFFHALVNLNLLQFYLFVTFVSKMYLK